MFNAVLFSIITSARTALWYTSMERNSAQFAGFILCTLWIHTNLLGKCFRLFSLVFFLSFLFSFLLVRFSSQNTHFPHKITFWTAVIHFIHTSYAPTRSPHLNHKPYKNNDTIRIIIAGARRNCKGNVWSMHSIFTAAIDSELIILRLNLPWKESERERWLWEERNFVSDVNVLSWFERSKPR